MPALSFLFVLSGSTTAYVLVLAASLPDLLFGTRVLSKLANLCAIRLASRAARTALASGLSLGYQIERVSLHQLLRIAVEHSRKEQNVHRRFFAPH